MVTTVLACGTCGQVQEAPAPRPGTLVECCRCGAVITQFKRGSPSVTAALSLAALILYVPANIYPILRMTQYGVESQSTVWDGVVLLAQSNQWFVAIVVFLASIVIPLLKLAGLFFLTITARLETRRWLRFRTRLYKFIDVIGPWAMLDVFLLAVLVALVKLGQVATVLPGPGLIAFTCVVVLTIFASASFDPHLIWRRTEGCA
ncbi:MAG TPA: paraquat-inducible protein A [Burkholderiales bacterium]|jgi:paraquat-inducible protein A|nr:paraquat-inducible protein A [Burkholderiales bacterium]